MGGLNEDVTRMYIRMHVCTYVDPERERGKREKDRECETDRQRGGERERERVCFFIMEKSPGCERFVMVSRASTA